jgi:hypothetical protein
VDVGVGEREIHDIVQEGLALRNIEPKIRRPEFGQLPSNASPRKRKRRVGPGSHYKDEVGGQVVKKVLDASVEVLPVNGVIVIKHQSGRSFEVLQVLNRIITPYCSDAVDKPIKERGHIGPCSSFQIHVGSYVWPERPDRRDDVLPEPLRIIVSFL